MRLTTAVGFVDETMITIVDLLVYVAFSSASCFSIFLNERFCRCMLSALVRTPLDCRCQRSRRMMSSKNSSLTAVLRNEFLDMRLVGDREGDS